MCICKHLFIRDVKSEERKVRYGTSFPLIRFRGRLNITGSKRIMITKNSSYFSMSILLLHFPTHLAGEIIEVSIGRHVSRDAHSTLGEACRSKSLDTRSECKVQRHLGHLHHWQTVGIIHKLNWRKLRMSFVVCMLPLCFLDRLSLQLCNNAMMASKNTYVPTEAQWSIRVLDRDENHEKYEKIRKILSTKL